MSFDKTSHYIKELNCLPNRLEILQLPKKYNLQIKNIPLGLKKLICSKDYTYIENFDGIEVEIY